MGATRAKTAYLTEVRFERFLAGYLPNVWLVTFTFHENVTDKAEAMRRWKPVADYLKRHQVDWCGVWQQQKRGAWHHHVLVNCYLNVVALRAFVVERGWGQFVNIRKVGDGSKDFPVPGRVVKYLTRYLTRDFCDHVPLRVRLTSGKSSNKVGTTRFQWVGGLSRAWRVGLELFWLACGRMPRWRRDGADFDRVMEWGCRELGMLEFLPVRVAGANPYETG